jgi:hypothetical protein
VSLPRPLRVEVTVPAPLVPTFAHFVPAVPNRHEERSTWVPDLPALGERESVSLDIRSHRTSYGLAERRCIVRLLTGHTHSFRTQGAADTTLEQLRQGSFVLIGGFNKLWTKRLSQELRFRLVTLNDHENVIQDSQHPSTVWTLDATWSALANSRDYGLVSCFFDPEPEQHVILAAGIGKSGTEAAADFLTNERGLDAWFKTVHPRSGANLEVVVSTDVIEGEHGPPHVIAYSIW